MPTPGTLERLITGLVGGAFALRLLDDKKPWWARAAYGLVGFDLLRAAWESKAIFAGGQDSGLLSRSSSAVSAQRTPLKFNEKRVRSIDERVALVHEQLLKGTRDPVVYGLAREVLSRKCGDKFCIAPKDNVAEIEALFFEVKKRVRYTWDPLDYDAFQTPKKSLELASGDCFVKGTKVLTNRHQLVPIESLRIGDEIWGLSRWSKVTNTWEKGTLKTWRVALNNGSSMRLTPDHKVWVYDCKLGHEEAHFHGDCHCRLEERDLVRRTVRELKPGMVLTQPDRIPFGSETMDPDRAFIEGLYISDGWAQSNHFSISGQDGCPKEEQKRLVETICTRLGIPTKWYRKYISVKSREWAHRMKTMGTRAPQKHALSINLDEGPALQLLRGILADSGKNTHGSGSTFTTTSRELWLQTRVLLKMAGLTASERYITDHGGLGLNPIWRLGIRGVKNTVHQPKLLRVKKIHKDNTELPCFDVETDDHFVWLPEADWTTSQCDDEVSLLGAMLRSVGYKVRSRVVRTTGNSSWNHIYLLVQVPGSKEWLPLDATVDQPPGWEVPGQYVQEVRDFDVVESGQPASPLSTPTKTVSRLSPQPASPF